MLNRTMSVRRPSANRPRHSSAFQIEKPNSLLPKLKYYYDKYHLRNYAPFLLLFLYSLFGAYLFHIVEYEHEKELIKQEHEKLNSIRNNTLANLRHIMAHDSLTESTRLRASQDILTKFEDQIFRNKLPDALEWDMWGALFYVGTIFTTIGYGNITPRTTGGRALSILYALFGIPLVFAILSQFGRTLTTWLSEAWVRYRRYVRTGRKNRERRESAAPKQRKWSYASKDQIIIQMEESQTSAQLKTEESEDELNESRTIPISLALFLCLGYICACAGLFCIWETRWSYFTSLYFIFISLSTIGLGDVIPDHPHMLILMFWLVIIGLSIVSMLLSVIQIKMEEWLYHLLIKMQQKYQQAVENGEIVEGDQIFENLMENEPWFMRNMASHLISEKQAAQVEKQAETYERTTRELNNKTVQTDGPPLNIPVSPETQRSTFITAADTFGRDATIGNNPFETAADESAIRGERASRDEGSQWDVPSLPMDDSKNSSPSIASNTDSFDRIQSGLQQLVLLAHEPRLESLMIDEETQVIEEKRPTRDNGTATPQVGTRDFGQDMRIGVEDKDQMTSQSLVAANQTNASTSVDIKMHSIQTMFPEYNEEDEESLTQNSLLLGANEKRRRFSNSKLVTSFEEDQRREFESKSTQSSPTFQRSNLQNSSSQYSIEQKTKSMHSIGVQYEEGDKSVHDDMAFMETGAQYSIEDPKIMESIGVQCTNTNLAHLIESSAQYSIEDPKITQSIGIQCSYIDDLTHFMEFGVQCSPQMMDEQVAAGNQNTSIDIDDELSIEPRGTVYKAKVMRSSSTISLNSFELDKEPQPIKEKLDIVLQTEDSYLRIARRLDEYRTIKTQHSLHVYSANPDTAAKSAQHAIKQSLSDRRDSKTHYLLLGSPQSQHQWTRKRSSRNKNRRVSFQTIDPEVTTPEITIPEEKEKLDPRIEDLKTDRPQIRVDSPARDNKAIEAEPETTPEANDGKLKTKKIVRVRKKSKSTDGGPSEKATTSKEDEKKDEKTPDLFESCDRNENELKIESTQVVKAETLSGQVLRAHATKHQSHLLTTRKTSTPVELESGHGTSYGVMETSLSQVQSASSQMAELLNRKTSLPTESTTTQETQKPEDQQRSANSGRRRTSIFSLIRRDTTDSQK